MKTPIGANVKIKWVDKTSCPAKEYWVHFSFSEEPDCEEWTDEVLDSNGVHDYDIFFYVDDEAGLQELIKYPCDNGYQILDYTLVYSIKEMLANKLIAFPNRTEFENNYGYDI
jgi:hypothetical protein